MHALSHSPPATLRSEPAKQESTIKRASLKGRVFVHVPEGWCPEDEVDLCRFALKRNSLEKALGFDAYSSTEEPSTSAPCPPLSRQAKQNTKSQPARPVLKRTAHLPPTAAPPPIVERLMLYWPAGCECPERASIDSDSVPVSDASSSSSCTSTSGSRRSSISSVSSTASSANAGPESESESSTTQKPQPRLPARCASAVAAALRSFVHTHIQGPPTPEELMFLDPLPMMKEKHRARNARKPPPGFSPLAPGEKRTRFVCPKRTRLPMRETFF
ncbi:hypothetical protein DFH08DRAFT_960779 [Mycena albidolilacea]|uniref:Uncharacterized protein n=1 Tax=Mycena albidolilacea TaxID=1033008 RepID=A0AAD7A164_9AGAR|nr:hypothetical protein DFH08DRAFT_960779 [Mycena albidolilacea]